MTNSSLIFPEKSSTHRGLWYTEIKRIIYLVMYVCVCVCDGVFHTEPLLSPPGPQTSVLTLHHTVRTNRLWSPRVEVHSSHTVQSLSSPPAPLWGLRPETPGAFIRDVVSFPPRWGKKKEKKKDAGWLSSPTCLNRKKEGKETSNMNITLTP